VIGRNICPAAQAESIFSKKTIVGGAGPKDDAGQEELEVADEAMGLALGVLLLAIPVFAHYGGTSLYDVKKEVTAEATVTDFSWTNPHVEIGLDAKDDNGKVKHLVLETSRRP